MSDLDWLSCRDNPRRSITDSLQLNYNRIAALFGQGTTYHAIEGQFRSVRKEAQQLKEDLENGTVDGSGSADTATTASQTHAGVRRRGGNDRAGAVKRSKNKTSAQAKGQVPKRDGVITGRVTKSKSITPTNGNDKIKLTGDWTELENHNAIRGFKEEVESSEASTANTPANLNPLDYSIISYDGTCELGMYDLSFDGPFRSSFATDCSYMFEA